MRLFQGAAAVVISTLFFTAAVLFPLGGAAQDMDSIEGVYRQQYGQYTALESRLQDQMDALSALKAQVDSLISQVAGSTTENYAQEAEKYRQLQLLLPSAIQYSVQLGDRARQLAEVERRKDELRSKILERQSALPVWWTGR
jgi:predicted  nucleic acid-binding Zn-ribbon protein